MNHRNKNCLYYNKVGQCCARFTGRRFVFGIKRSFYFYFHIKLKIPGFYRVGKHGVVIAFPLHGPVIFLNLFTEFRVFIQLFCSRKQNPRRVVHPFMGQRALSLGNDLPGVESTAGGFGSHTDESGGNLPAHIADVGAAKIDGLVGRENVGVDGRGVFISSKLCRIRIILLRILWFFRLLHGFHHQFFHSRNGQ